MKVHQKCTKNCLMILNRLVNRLFRVAFCAFESHRGHDFKTRFHLAFSLVGAGFCLSEYSLSFTLFHALSRVFCTKNEPKVSHVLCAKSCVNSWANLFSDIRKPRHHRLSERGVPWRGLTPRECGYSMAYESVDFNRRAYALKTSSSPSAYSVIPLNKTCRCSSVMRTRNSAMIGGCVWVAAQ